MLMEATTATAKKKIIIKYFHYNTKIGNDIMHNMGIPIKTKCFLVTFFIMNRTFFKDFFVSLFYRCDRYQILQ